MKLDNCYYSEYLATDLIFIIILKPFWSICPSALKDISAEMLWV